MDMIDNVPGGLAGLFQVQEALRRYLMRYPIGSLWHVEWSRAGGVKVLGPNLPEAASTR
jgi:hypothetical protein